MGSFASKEQTDSNLLLRDYPLL